MQVGGRNQGGMFSLQEKRMQRMHECSLTVIHVPPTSQCVPLLPREANTNQANVFFGPYIDLATRHTCGRLPRHHDQD